MPRQFFCGPFEGSLRLEKAHRLGSIALGGAVEMMGASTRLGESESATGWIPVVGSVTKSTIKVLHKAWNQFQEELKKA